VIAEYEGTSCKQRYFYGPGIDEPIAMQKFVYVYYYHYDGLGNVAALSDKNAILKERYSYDVFGEPNHTSDANNPYLLALSMSPLVVVPSSRPITNPLRLLSVASGTASQSEKKFLHD